MTSLEHRNKELKKHVATIHSANSITLLQRKISNALLFYAYPNLLKKEEHEITIRKLAEIIGFGGNNLQRIKDALKGLISTVLEWNVIDTITGEEDWTASTILASANIKGPKCTYAYSPAMRRLLYLPTTYGKISMSIQAKFQSSYGLALYENCVRYKGLPYTKWFSLEMFRKLMGVSPETYLIFRDLKRRVIDCAVEEVNKYSELKVDYELQREVREVKSIRFKLKEDKKLKAFVPINPSYDERVGEQEINNSNQEIREKLLTFGFSTKQIGNVTSKYDVEYIKNKINYIESTKAFRAGKIEGVAAYLFSALENNYQPSNSSQQINLVNNRDRENIDKAKKDREEQAYKLKRQYTEYLNSQLVLILQKLTKAEFDNLLKLFTEFLINKNEPLTLNIFKKEGLENKIIKSCFRNFLKESNSHLLHGILDFNSYKQKNFS